MSPVFKDPKPRTFAFVETPNLADPAGVCPIYEYNAATVRKSPEGVVQMNQAWSGWRAGLIAWLVQKLLPKPEYLYKVRQ